MSLNLTDFLKIEACEKLDVQLIWLLRQRSPILPAAGRTPPPSSRYQQLSGKMVYGILNEVTLNSKLTRARTLDSYFSLFWA